MNKPNGKRNQAGRSAAETALVPAIAGWPELFNASMQIGTEVNNFLRHRISEDMALPGRVASSHSVEDLSRTYSEFFETASHDYVNEIEKLTQLVTEASPAAPQVFSPFGLQPFVTGKPD